MASDPKMVPTTTDVDAFLDAVPDENRQAEASAVIELMRSVTGEPPVMWGSSIVGFGSYQYRYESGRTGAAPLAAFSPRKANLVVYLLDGFQDRYPELLERLGSHKAGKSCLYLKRLGDVDLNVLRELIERSTHVGSAAD